MSITTTQDNESKVALLKRTICKGATDDELELFSMVCKRTGLDPFMKQIYPVKRWSSSEKREVMTMQTSIDGFRLIAERTGNYSPGREATYQYDGDKNPVSATSYVKKRTADGTWHEVAATAYYEEYVQRSKDGKVSQFWDRMPHVMLAKCAESLALRKAFPAEMSGIYTAEEMSQASKVDDIEPPITEAQCAEIDAYLMKIDDQDYMTKLESYVSNTLKADSIYGIKQRDFNKLIKSLERKINERSTNDGQETVA